MFTPMSKSKTLTFKKAGVGLLLSIFGFMMLAAHVQTTHAATVPQITNHYAETDPYNPLTGNFERFFFTLDTGALVTFKIQTLSGTDVVVLASNATTVSGASRVEWLGRAENGSYVSPGVYKYVISARKSGSIVTSTVSGTFTVAYETGNPGGTNPGGTNPGGTNPGGTNPGGTNIPTAAPIISNDFASPNPFNPEETDTNIYFGLNQPAQVTVSIYKNGFLVKNIVSNMSHTSGNFRKIWDGRDTNGNLVSEGTYTYKITASNSFGHDIEQGTVTVDYGDDPNDPDPNDPDPTPDASNTFALPNPFDPNDEPTYIYFTLNTQSEVTIKILDSNGADSNGVLIKTLVTDLLLSQGDHTKAWNGRDDDGNIVPEGTYTYEITLKDSDDVETGTVTVDYDTPVNTDQIISDAFTSPQTFDPSEGETTTLHYSLNNCGDVTIKVYKTSDDSFVKTLQLEENECAGEHTKVWDGTDSSGNIVDNGDYYLRITAQDDTEVELVKVEDEDDGGGSGDELDVYDLDVDPFRFDPDNNEDTELTYKLNECADVTVKVLDDDGDFVVKLKDEVSQCEGTHRVTWDGEDDDGDVVDDGLYTFMVTAENDDNESDSEDQDVRVDTDDDDNDGDDEEPRITQVDVDDSRFNPYNENARIRFRLNTCAEVTIEVRDDDNDLVREIIDEKGLCKGTHSYIWNGRDEDGDIVDQDDYEFVIIAENDEGDDTERADVEVDYNDGFINDPLNRCSGYFDVFRYDPYCEWIIYVTNLGIFGGYPDGYFRPNQPINRAETTKVITLGFNYDILPSDGTNLGFWDVDPYAWYMPYLRTARQHGIIQGYPDGSFQPARTVNRVELLKIFLETSNVYVPNCTTQAYPDTLANVWYSDYVCYAKTYGLMNTDAFGNFNPAMPMTRADVAYLFYRFNQLGLYNNNYNYNYNYNNFNNYNGFLNNIEVDPRITNAEIDDDELDEGEGTRIYYELNTCADLTVEIVNDNGRVEVEILDDVYRCAGSYTLFWDGEDEDGDDLREGDYEVRIIADNREGRDTETIDFEVGDTRGDIRITNLELDDDRFDPDIEEVEISFRINECADITVNVYNDDGERVVNLWDDRPRCTGTHLLDWDGEDDDGDVVVDGDYEIRVRAENEDGTDRDEILVEVNS